MGQTHVSLGICEFNADVLERLLDTVCRGLEEAKFRLRSLIRVIDVPKQDELTRAGVRLKVTRLDVVRDRELDGVLAKVTHVRASESQWLLAINDFLDDAWDLAQLCSCGHMQK